MSGFSSNWLSLREPADTAARDSRLVAHLKEWSGGRALRVVDLGCGTGATWRALAPHLPRSEWLLVDNDPTLLEQTRRRTDAKIRRADLFAEVEAIVAEADIVTASALFDLCSGEWIDRLVTAIPKNAAVYATLNYDGREKWLPAHRLETKALAAFHQHQLGDKGFGLSLGSGAAAYLSGRLREAGWKVEEARSDWRLASEQKALIAALAEGAAQAVADTRLLAATKVEEWRAARIAAQCVEIGHVDVLALPER